MPYAEREFLCDGCGAIIARRAAANARPRCAHCAIKRATDVMLQIHKRDGDAYEQWLLASLEALMKMLEVYRARKAYDDPIKALRGE